VIAARAALRGAKKYLRFFEGEVPRVMRYLKITREGEAALKRRVETANLLGFLFQGRDTIATRVSVSEQDF
jgi:hypothetical protein